jgi:uncharacterized protein (AIM24 family)
VSETFRGGTANIAGTLVPQLHFVLDGGGGVFFEHHTLLWKDAQLQIGLKKLPGGIKRKIAGMDFFLTLASGPGEIAFSMDTPGRVLTHHIDPGQTLLVREHQFLAATDNLDYTFERLKGVRNMLVGGSGFFMDKFKATNGDALVWLHGHGNVFLAELGPGEQLDVEAGAWLWKDPTVHLESITLGLKMGVFGGGGKLTWNRFTGPGRIALQTMFISPLEGVESGSGAAQAAGAVGVGALLGKMLE